ncbi:MAG: nucleotidyltransferase domain-containing protein [Promethearchaeota archaeon]
MYKSSSKNSIISQKKIRKFLKKLVNKLISNYDISQIILFGSFARGDYHEYSDIDLIIIGYLDDNFFNRIGKVLDLVPPNIELEPLVYTPKEFEKMKENENPFILNVLEEGIILYKKETDGGEN